jgi:epoxyqueuosine reductase
MSKLGITAALREEALRLGFDLVGVAQAQRSPDFDFFRRWLGAGFAAGMRFLADRADAYRHPSGVLDGVRSVMMLGVNYRTVEPAPVGAGQARIARFAWGEDYHTLIGHRLGRLCAFHHKLLPAARSRGVVDTAPLLERQFGRLAGLGWIGKNSSLIHPVFGSWFYLAALLTTEPLEYDAPFAADRCGSCRACLDACPTGALFDARHLDARKCLSYLTIESRDPLPAALRSACGDRLFGCDACQEVCPWNRDTPANGETAFAPGPGMNPVDLSELLALDDATFRNRFRHTSLWRAKRAGILRNAAVVLENQSRS